MIKLFTLPEDRKIEVESRQYFNGRAGVYPGMLKLILSDDFMAGIKKKLKNCKKLTVEEQETLYRRYVDGQNEFMAKCDYIADWANFNRELLFLDVLGTDIAQGIYSEKLECFEKMTKLFDELPKEIVEDEKNKAVNTLLHMTPEEHEEYKILQEKTLESGV